MKGGVIGGVWEVWGGLCGGGGIWIFGWMRVYLQISADDGFGGFVNILPPEGDVACIKSIHGHLCGSTACNQ